MPLDTSIPLQVQAPQFANPVNMLDMQAQMQQRQANASYNAMREQALQQEMQKNALGMQYTAEDRARADAARRQALAQTAADKALKDRVIKESGGDPAKAADLAIRLGRPDLAESYAKGRESIAKAGTEESNYKIKAYDNAIDKHTPLLGMVRQPQDAAQFTSMLYDDPVLGPDLAKFMPREQAVAAAAQQFQADPTGFIRAHSIRGKDFYEATVKAQEALAPKPESIAAGATVIDTNKNSPTFGQVIAKGGPTATEQKAAIQTKQLSGSIDTAISTLEDLVKPNSLLNESTASGGGALADKAAGFFGYATPGSIAASQLKVLADPILKMVPRFEGPQSDKDTKSYQEAAGQLGNEYLPAAQRKAAAETILKLFKARKNQFTSADLPEATPGAATSAGGHPEDIQSLINKYAK